MYCWLKPTVLLLAGCGAYAQECSRAEISLSAVGKNDVVTNLREDSIGIKIGGNAAKIFGVSLDTHPRRVVLLVDTSGSMSESGQNHRWGLGLLISGFAADALPANASAILVTFGEKIAFRTTGFQTRSEVQQRILDLRNEVPAGRTPLLDSLEQAMSIFGAPEFGDTIYLVSDGEDDKSTVTLSQLQPQLIEHGIRIFSFLVQPPTWEERGPNPNLLKDLAESTGGDFFSFPEYASGRKNGEMPRLALQIARRVQELYKVEFKIPERASRKRQLKVALSPKPKHGDVIQLAYPRQLRRCDLLP